MHSWGEIWSSAICSIFGKYKTFLKNLSLLIKIQIEKETNEGGIGP